MLHLGGEIADFKWEAVPPTNLNFASRPEALSLPLAWRANDIARLGYTTWFKITAFFVLFWRALVFASVSFFSVRTDWANTQCYQSE